MRLAVEYSRNQSITKFVKFSKMKQMRRNGKMRSEMHRHNGFNQNIGLDASFARFIDEQMRYLSNGRSPTSIPNAYAKNSELSDAVIFCRKGRWIVIQTNTGDLEITYLCNLSGVKPIANCSQCSLLGDRIDG
eukprot:266388_1